MKLERLGNYIKQIRGLSYKPNEIHDEYQEGRIAILKANNIQDNVLDDTDLIYIDKSKTKTEQKIKKGDILIAASSGSKEIVGKNIYFRNDYEAVFGAFCKVVRINEKVNSEFISHFFKTPIYKNHIRNSIQGANINNLKNEHIDELKLAIPSLEEQKHIAVVLSKAEALIAERKQSIQLLDEYLKSTFLEMFGDPVKNEKGWEIVNLGEHCDIGSSKRVFVEDLVDNGIPFYRGTEIGQMAEGISIIPTLYITQKHFEELKSHTDVPQVGDLLLPSICPDGRILRVINNEPFYFKDGRVLWIKSSKSKFNNIFLQKTLKEIFRLNYNNIASGTTFAELKIVALKKIKTPFPPLTLQTQFAQIVEKTEALKAQYKEHLQELEQLYGALSQRAFRGG